MKKSTALLMSFLCFLFFISCSSNSINDKTIIEDFKLLNTRYEASTTTYLNIVYDDVVIEKSLPVSGDGVKIVKVTGSAKALDEFGNPMFNLVYSGNMNYYKYDKKWILKDNTVELTSERISDEILQFWNGVSVDNLAFHKNDNEITVDEIYFDTNSYPVEMIASFTALSSYVAKPFYFAYMTDFGNGNDWYREMVGDGKNGYMFQFSPKGSENEIDAFAIAICVPYDLGEMQWYIYIGDRKDDPSLLGGQVDSCFLRVNKEYTAS